MARRKKGSDNENLDRWLLTYADLITLLLAFFIVMYSISQIDAKKFGQMSEALAGVLKGGTIVIKQGSQIGALEGGGVLKKVFLKSLGDQIKRDFQGLGNEKMVNTEVSERGLIIHIMESALFETGSAVLTERARNTLDIVAVHLKNVPNHIRVEGHTDDRPINTVRYPSNWELASARATEVVRHFTDKHKIPPDKISALGYGEFRPSTANDGEEGRAKNRRVDIVVLTMEISATEPTSEHYSSTN